MYNEIYRYANLYEVENTVLWVIREYPEGMSYTKTIYKTQENAPYGLIIDSVLILESIWNLIKKGYIRTDHEFKIYPIIEE